MIDAYNTANPEVLITKLTREANRPATGVSWNEAARFVNWLNTSTGHTAAYQFDTTGANDNISLWTVADAGFDASNPFRNSNANYFLPSEDEWYKAAYYDPNTNGGAGGYWDYATGSDTAPTAVAGGTTPGTAVYDGPGLAGSPADITNAGGLSPYGTMAQNGNVWEWGESGTTAPNDSVDETRIVRGGGYYFNSAFGLPSGLQSSHRYILAIPTSSASHEGGFRVAAIPEPSSVSLLAVGALGVLMRRKRR